MHHIMEKTLHPWGEGKNISRCHLGEKTEKVKRKEGKYKRKGRKGEEKEKMTSKRVKTNAK
jgi:hypothetical protein